MSVRIFLNIRSLSAKLPLYLQVVSLQKYVRVQPFSRSKQSFLTSINLDVINKIFRVYSPGVGQCLELPTPLC